MKKLLCILFIFCFISIGYSQTLNNEKVDMFFNESDSTLVLDLFFTEGQSVHYAVFGTGVKQPDSIKIKGIIETQEEITTLNVDLSTLPSGEYSIELGMPYKGRIYRQIININ